MSNSDLKITRELFIPASVDVVWAFLMNEEKMKDWLKADKFVIDMSDGGEIEFPLSFGEEKYFILGEFSILLIKEKYAFVWRERNMFGEEWFNCTIVNFDLEKKDNGTLLKFLHDGFKYLPSDKQKPVYERYVNFWKSGSLLEKLSSLIVTDQ